MPFGKFGKIPFYGKVPGAFFKAPIGLLAGSYPRAIGPGFAKFPPFGVI
jgi:hypothetical protein